MGQIGPKGKIFGLVDCNNFYASCERVFAPAFRSRPVVVLSNNDGCVIARSAEAKALNIPMGAPAFKWEAVFKKHGVAVFSSNYALYGDLSARVMAVLDRFAPRMEIYSIDEAFLELAGIPGGAADHARAIRSEVYRCTGMPVSIGLGPTKTLAKVAGRFAKKHPRFRGVFDAGAMRDPAPLLEQTPLKDVWGIGPRRARQLAGHGITTALQFRDLDREWVRRKMTVTGLHTLLELRGISCIDLEEMPKPKKNVVVSRSFGRPLSDLEELKEALAAYTSRAAEKLRAQHSTASTVLVFLHTNKFKKNLPQYSNARSQALSIPTAHTPTLIAAAQRTLERIWKPGYSYKKTGVMLGGVEQAGARQLSLLEIPPHDRPLEEPLMRTLDRINDRWGRETLRYAATGLARSWDMRRTMRSNRFTTCWEELPIAKA